MAYTKQTWSARVREFANRITLGLVSGSTYDVTQVEGTITTAGSPFNETRMNYIEDGIYNASLAAESAVQSVGATTPLATTGGTTPTLSIQAATPAQAGSMSAAQASKLADMYVTAVVDLTVSQSLAAGATVNFSIPIGASDFTHFDGIVIRSGNQAGSAVLIKKTPTDDYATGMALSTTPAVWTSKIAGVVTASVDVPFASQQLGYRVLDTSHYAKIVSITFSSTNIVFAVKNDHGTAATLSFRILGEVGYK